MSASKQNTHLYFGIRMVSHLLLDVTHVTMLVIMFHISTWNVC